MYITAWQVPNGGGSRAARIVSPDEVESGWQFPDFLVWVCMRIQEKKKHKYENIEQREIDLVHTCLTMKPISSSSVSCLS